MKAISDCFYQHNKSKSKIILFFLFLVFVLIGFVIKIPLPLRKFGDKNLHAAFYFSASIFLYFLNRKNMINISFLVLFGVFIEYLQQFANRITHSHIHGRFDIEDIYANIKGVMYYLVVFSMNYFFRYFHRFICQKNSNI